MVLYIVTEQIRFMTDDSMGMSDEENASDADHYQWGLEFTNHTLFGTC